MKTASLFATLVCLTFAIGCASSSGPSRSIGARAETGSRQGLGFPIDTNTTLLVGRQFVWWPAIEHGYALPGGPYRAEGEDEKGVFFAAPAGLHLESINGRENVKGGIYLPKTDATGIRGHVYLFMPGWRGGWKSFMLPDEFFSGYGNTWVLVDPDGKHLPPPHPMPLMH